MWEKSISLVKMIYAECGLVNTIPIIGLVGVPKKDRLFILMVPEKFLIEKVKQKLIVLKNNQR